MHGQEQARTSFLQEQAVSFESHLNQIESGDVYCLLSIESFLLSGHVLCIP